MTRDFFLIILTVLFAFNMGASGVAPSFASTYGAGLIRRGRLIFLFSAFVVFGAVVLGNGVTTTLGKNLLPPSAQTYNCVFAILGAATGGLFLANVLKIPQSTSQVTVGAIAGAGIYFHQLNTKTIFFKILPAWIILPLLSYVLTWLLYRIIYPPRSYNLYIYQKLFANEKKLKISAILASCYVAFAIGSNNVGNAAGPLFGAGILEANLGLLLISPLFGIGALLLGKGTLETAGKEMVPIGLFSGTLVAFVTATLLLTASILGIPQSLVQLSICSIFAISCLKNGHRHSLGHYLTKKTLLIWTLTPVISMALSFLFLSMMPNHLSGP